MAKKSFAMNPEPVSTPRSSEGLTHELTSLQRQENVAWYRFVKEQLQRHGGDWEATVECLRFSQDRPDVNEQMRRAINATDPVRWLIEMTGGPMRLPPEVGREDDMRAFRGRVFESMAMKEFNDSFEAQEIAQFVLYCLQNPAAVSKEQSSLKNPDYLGVHIDPETSAAVISGMFEVKTGQYDERTERQIKDFYPNLKFITNAINNAIKQDRRLQNTFPAVMHIPRAGGLVLAPENQMAKEFVVPRGVPNRESYEAAASARGWGMRESAFGMENVNIVAVALREYYLAHKAYIDARRAAEGATAPAISRGRAA